MALKSHGIGIVSSELRERTWKTRAGKDWKTASFTLATTRDILRFKKEGTDSFTAEYSAPVGAPEFDLLGMGAKIMAEGATVIDSWTGKDGKNNTKLVLRIEAFSRIGEGQVEAPASQEEDNEVPF